MPNLETLADAILDGSSITVVDAGAAGGLDARWRPVAAHLRTIGFEPLDPESDDGRTLLLPYALGSSDRDGTLLVTRRVSMTSLLPPARALLARFWDKPKHTEIVRELPVKLRRLDDLAAERGFAPDMVKIDVQGGEQDILEGATRCLDESVLAAEIELSFLRRYEGLTPFAQVVEFMADHGFELIDMWRIKRYRHRNDAGVIHAAISPGLRSGRLAFCDTFFVRRDDDLMARCQADRAVAARTIVLLLIYGKADMAARIHDATRAQFDARANAAMDRYGAAVARYGRQRIRLQKLFDKLAKKS